MTPLVLLNDTKLALIGPIMIYKLEGYKYFCSEQQTILLAVTEAKT